MVVDGLVDVTNDNELAQSSHAFSPRELLHNIYRLFNEYHKIFEYFGYPKSECKHFIFVCLFELMVYVPFNSNGHVGTLPPFYGTFTQH